MTRRYYVPDLTSQQPIVSLPADEAAHAVRVMRVSAGETIELFDGRGHQATAMITHADRKQCVCRCDQPPARVDREPSVTLEIATALPKPDRAKEMVERLTELGVKRLHPLVFERTQRPPTDSTIDKLKRIVVEACKQSGRNELMTIEPIRPFAKWIDDLEIADRMAYVLMPDAAPLAAESAPRWDTQRSALAVIGPEGGLTPAELDRCLASGMVSVTLGRRILRIETAASVVASRLLTD